MWTCTKCSYAYNPLWVELCDICALRRTPPSLTQPSLITVTKDEATKVTETRSDDKSNVTINKDETVKFSKSKSGNSFDEIAAIVEVPMATFEQDLDDDVMFVSDTVDSPQEWTCKKCTLVNTIQNKACVVCGGSKLRSVTAIEDMTLRKGEFWTCAQCTLKNSLSKNTCIACKSARQVLVISGQQTNYRPYTSTPASNLNNKPAATHHNRQIVSSNSSSQNSSHQTQSSLAPPIHRVLRSPSPKYDKTASGAIPKRHSTGGVVLGKSTNITNRHSSGGNATNSTVVKVWHCPACTYENSSASVVCDICSSPRGLASSSKSSNDINASGSTSNNRDECSTDLSRQESKLMENLRKIEESEARNKWENIIQYCKEVCDLVQFLNCFSILFGPNSVLFLRTMNCLLMIHFHQHREVSTIIQIQMSMVIQLFNGVVHMK